MRGSHGVNSRAALAKDLRRWMGCVEAIARDRSARLHLDRHAYQTLHERVIAQAQVLVGSGSGDIRSIAQEVVATVQPWISPLTLEKADGEILSDLLDRCRRIERALLGRRRAMRGTARRVLLCIVAAAVAFVLLSIAWGHESKFANTLYYGTRRLWDSIVRADDLQKLYALGTVLILISIYNVSKVARS
jgi:hypothetical protein